MILLIDNYDSFTYNVVQLLGSFGQEVRVVRNDALSVDEIAAFNPQQIVLSPGPGRPEEAGVCIEVIQQLSPRIPTLGICLGHQAICAAFGAKITYAKQIKHGKVSTIDLQSESRLLGGLGKEMKVARYHSLAVAQESLPPELHALAKTSDGEVMAVEHQFLPIYGFQFHPESVLTPRGGEIIQRFLDLSEPCIG